MIDNQSKENIKIKIYIFLKSLNNKMGIMVDKSIIKPPIVGVPSLSFSPGKLSSLVLSPICFFLKKFIIFLPKIVEIKRERIKLIADLNDMYWNKLAPINWYSFSNISNK